MRIGIRTTNLTRHPSNNASWIEPEEFAYPNGGQTRKCHVMFPDGKMRIAFCGIPDTYFSIPAHCSIKGKYIAGFIFSGDKAFEFRIMDTHKPKFTEVTGYIFNQ